MLLVPRWLADQLSGLRHSTSGPVCILYGAHDSSGSHPQQESKFGISCLPGAVGQGSVVAFNVLRPNGSYVGYRYAIRSLENVVTLLHHMPCLTLCGWQARHVGEAISVMTSIKPVCARRSTVVGCDNEKGHDMRAPCT